MGVIKSIYSDFMLDFETFGTGPYCVPARISMTHFQMENKYTFQDLIPTNEYLPKVHSYYTPHPNVSVFHAWFSIQELLKLGFELEDSALMWWAIDNDIRAVLPPALNYMAPLAVIVQELDTFITRCNVAVLTRAMAEEEITETVMAYENMMKRLEVRLHIRATDYDSPIAKQLFYRAGIKWPFDHRVCHEVRDYLRTAHGTAVPKYDEPEGFVKHNPTHDCAIQIIQEQNARRILRERGCPI